jgi:UDP-glucose 4-epimerase
MINNKKNVLVIGGSGFMGSHTADELSKRGFSVTIFDNNLSDWKTDDQKIIIGDIFNQTDLKNAMKDIDYVYHFAGIADILESKKDPVKTINTNIVGTSLALKASIDNSVKRFIMASTLYVYSPYGSFYRASKQASEIIIETFHKEYGINFTFLRYGSLYGPRAQDWNGLQRYISQIVNNGSIIYNGSGAEKREYIHAYDAARISVDILSNEYLNKAVTITGQQNFSSKEVLEMIFEISGIRKKIIYKENSNPDHYISTPYRYSPKSSEKITPTQYKDFGEGILEIIESIKK